MVAEMIDDHQDNTDQHNPLQQAKDPSGKLVDKFKSVLGDKVEEGSFGAENALKKCKW